MDVNIASSMASTPPSAFFAPVPAYLTPVVLLIVGSVIAFMSGFDIVFNLVTGDVPWLRSALFAVLTIVGLLCARKTGLILAPHGLSYPTVTALGIAFLVAIAIWFVDAVLFRSLLPPVYAASFTDRSLEDRLLYFMLRAFNENIFYRLFFMSTLVWSMSIAWRAENGGIPTPVFWIAIVFAQAIPMLINEAPYYPDPMTLVFLLYVIVRFILAGILWGYLYWRHGFVTAEIAHVSTHIFLQPIMGYALQNP